MTGVGAATDTPAAEDDPDGPAAEDDDDVALAADEPFPVEDDPCEPAAAEAADAADAFEDAAAPDVDVDPDDTDPDAAFPPEDAPAADAGVHAWAMQICPVGHSSSVLQPPVGCSGSGVECGHALSNSAAPSSPIRKKHSVSTSWGVARAHVDLQIKGQKIRVDPARETRYRLRYL